MCSWWVVAFGLVVVIVFLIVVLLLIFSCLRLIWVAGLDCLITVSSVVVCMLMCIETWFGVFGFVVWVASVSCCVLVI